MSNYNVSKKRGKAKVKISDKRQVEMDKIIAAHNEKFNIKLIKALDRAQARVSNRPPDVPLIFWSNILPRA
ncbi:MAG: hypothetical protein K8S27_03890 [Candidatus Omnitrophica bacterium]|nr:hypothetical protein [Candidatus Omnitrophota bacterium]